MGARRTLAVALLLSVRPWKALMTAAVLFGLIFAMVAGIDVGNQRSLDPGLLSQEIQLVNED